MGISGVKRAQRYTWDMFTERFGNIIKQTALVILIKNSYRI